MLKSLYVKNFIIIDEIELEFNDGFSAFTGETGAGKSLIIDAISYLTGQRKEQGIIKNGANECTIEGVFDIKSDIHCIDLLKEEMIEHDGEVIVLRTMNNQGKSIIKINHRNVTLGFLNDCLINQIDIHNQHDTQYLLNKSNQVNLVDQYMNDIKLVDDVKSKYEAYSHFVKEYAALTDSSNKNNDLSFIEFQLKEIEDISPIIGEDDELLLLEKEYSGAAKTIDGINQANELFDNGINQKIHEALKCLNIDNTHVNELVKRLNEAYYEVQDIFESLKDYQSHLDVSEEEINRVQERLFDLNKIKRKYGLTLESVLNKKEELLKDKDFIINKQTILDTLQNSISKAKDEYMKAALILSKSRRASSLKLEKEITSILHELMLENVEFVIEFNDREMGSQGIDDITFMVSMNKGVSLRPLIKVASGGEKSRMMLGLKTIFTRLQGIQTIVFDEIDTGVSGVVAGCIGKKMSEIGKTTQVFSVTHLAQVASCSKYHYHVYKSSDKETKTQVELLQGDRRISELAMIASASDSENAKSAALEMFDKLQYECYE